MAKPPHPGLIVTTLAMIGLAVGAEAQPISGSAGEGRARQPASATAPGLAESTVLRGAKDPEDGYRAHHSHVRAQDSRSAGSGVRQAGTRGHQQGSAPGQAHSAAPEQGVETEEIFGFTLGSDTGEAGSKGLALEHVLALGKRAGTYYGLSQKLEFGFGVTDDLNLSFALLGDYHQVRNVPGFDDVRGRYVFNGFGAELRYRVLDRKTSPFGLTLHFEPSIARIDEGSGQAGRKLGSENKIIIDQELVPDTLFGAINLLYDIERMKERRNGFVAERSATAGIAGALSYKLMDDVFVGAEARYLRAYEGFALKKWQGHALYLGPTLHARVLEKGFISVAWNAQVAGREALNRRERAEAISEYNEAVDAAVAAGDPLPPVPVFARRGPLDLVNFEAHQFRVKVGLEF